MITLKDIDDIVINISQKLFEMYNAVPKSGLVYPFTRSKVIRVSEQETRVLFISELEKLLSDKNPFYYSIETPTKMTYRFSSVPKPKIDPSGQSASIDLSIGEMHGNSYQNYYNIEFKSGNPETKSIMKDFCKFQNENVPSIYIHTFYGDKNTLDSIMTKIRSSYKDYSKNIKKLYLIHINDPHLHGYCKANYSKPSSQEWNYVNRGMITSKLYI